VSSRKIISTQDYVYHLPDDRIAKYPLQDRDQSKLLIYREGLIEKDIFRNIDRYIPNQSQLFYNNTRVIQARLFFNKSGGTPIEILCLSPFQPPEYQTIFSQTENCVWECMVGNLKKWKTGSLQIGLVLNSESIILSAERAGMANNNVLVSFSWNGSFSFGKILDAIGNVPIPPYLNRGSELIDKERYQTIYSKFEGSIAAPTAGLHFTSEVFERLSKKQVSKHEITLHVGAGTFQPIKSQNALDHKMHSELFTVTRKTIETLSDMKGPILATGTTTLRTLESLYWLAVKSIVNKTLSFNLNQWEHTNLPASIPVKEAFNFLLSQMHSNDLETFTAQTEIMIVPGYTIRTIDGLITNFHQPKSTLLLLIAAFVGDSWKDIYKYALDNDLRFLSYGDSSLIWRSDTSIIP
jgi:S-adenosylmethionine:tRNA ribosyltransferase-isomerase